MPVLDGATTIGRQLDALATQQTTCRWELIIADNGSTDATREVIRSHPLCDLIPVRVLDASDRRGVNVGRNLGVREARGEIVLFCDCDDAVESGWIQAYWGNMEGQDRMISAGPLDTSLLADPRSTRWAQPLSSPRLFKSGLSCGYGANFGFHRSVWNELGGFDESFRLGFDEIEFFERAFQIGIACKWIADAGVHYRPTRKFRVAMAKAYRYGRGEVHFRSRHPGAMSPPLTPKAAVLSVLRGLRRYPILHPTTDVAIQQIHSICYRSGVLSEILSMRARSWAHSAWGQ